MKVPLASWGWAWAALRGALLDALSMRRREALLRLSPFVVLSQEYP